MRNHRKFGAALGLLLAVMLASTPVLSGGRNIYVSQDSYLNGTEIPKGSYKLSWKKNGSDDTVKISLLNGIKLVATAEGRLVESDSGREGDSLVYKVDDQGKRQIVGVRFGGKDEEIEIVS